MSGANRWQRTAKRLWPACCACGIRPLYSPTSQNRTGDPPAASRRHTVVLAEILGREFFFERIRARWFQIITEVVRRCSLRVGREGLLVMRFEQCIYLASL